MTPQQFKQARQLLGLSQVHMAAMLGYGSQTRISEIEGGKINPSESVTRLMAAYLAGYRPEDWPIVKSPLSCRKDAR